MTPRQAADLVRVVRAVCPAQHVDEWTPDAWAEILAPYSFNDARTAVLALASIPMPPGTSLFIGTNQIVEGINKIRGKRLQATAMPQPPAGLDPAEYDAWHKRTHEAIANGTYQPQPLPELPPPDEGRVRRLIAEATPATADTPEHHERRRQPDVDQMVDQAQTDAEKARQLAQLEARIASEGTPDADA